MKFIDTHCHIHSVDYPLDREETLRRAIAAGVTKVVCVATSDDDERVAREFAAEHPENVFFRGWEYGPDYHWCKSDDEKKCKKVDFEKRLAGNADGFNIFHVRDAFDDFFDVLAAHPEVRGVIHSYSGSPEDTQRALREFPNLYFGISGLAQFKNIEVPPLERLVLETDAPYLTPEPYRSRINEPAYIVNIAEWVAKKLGRSIAEVSKVTTQNGERAFNI